jgi:hypothetical protein
LKKSGTAPKWNSSYFHCSRLFNTANLRKTSSTLSWKQAWSITSFRIQFVGSVLFIAGLAMAWTRFFDYLEARSGPQLNDSFLALLPAWDISWIIFFFLYFGILVSIYAVAKYPVQMLLAMETYCLVTLLRMLSIELFPLNPPVDYIPLREPFAQLFVSDHRIISKDLFFSGHVATICAVYFPILQKKYRLIVFFCIVMVALGVLIQRVHYSIDVLFAPIATFACYYFCKRFLARF